MSIVLNKLHSSKQRNLISNIYIKESGLYSERTLFPEGCLYLSEINNNNNNNVFLLF